MRGTAHQSPHCCWGCGRNALGRHRVGELQQARPPGIKTCWRCAHDTAIPDRGSVIIGPKNTTLFRPALLAAYSAASARRKSLDSPESTSRSAVTPILTVAPTGSPLTKPADSANCGRRRSAASTASSPFTPGRMAGAGLFQSHASEAGHSCRGPG
jgi:hypothetical protein